MDLFHPIEHAVLAEYLGRNDLLARSAQGIDPRRTVDGETWDEARHGIAPLPNLYGGDNHAIENAVARIALQEIQDRLPQWAAVYPDGEEILGRKVKAKTDLPARTDITVPLFLFEINWADSGPGYSWPESYHVTWIPYYDAFVVTASNDCAEVFGYPDYAIGHFREGSIDAEVRKIIAGHWRDLAGKRQSRWAYLFSTGSVDADQAESWADEVWKECGEPLEQ